MCAIINAKNERTKNERDPHRKHKYSVKTILHWNSSVCQSFIDLFKHFFFLKIFSLWDFAVSFVIYFKFHGHSVNRKDWRIKQTKEANTKLRREERIKASVWSVIDNSLSLQWQRFRAKTQTHQQFQTRTKSLWFFISIHSLHFHWFICVKIVFMLLWMKKVHLFLNKMQLPIFCCLPFLLHRPTESGIRLDVSIWWLHTSAKSICTLALV